MKNLIILILLIYVQLNGNNQQFIQANSINTTINANSQVEISQKKVNELLISISTNGLGNVNEADLFSIANLCPLEAGNAVIQARNLLIQLKRTILYFEGNCFQVSRNDFALSNETKKSITISVYPNPNDGNMTFEYDLFEDVELHITNIMGEIICSYKLSKDDASITIDCKGLSNGVYLYKVIQKNSEINSNKFVIIK